MLTTDGRAKVVDFGLSKLTVFPSGAEEATQASDSMTAPHAVLGTVGYMAPEQVAGLTADARSDQFALGAILYEMLTGRRAFRRETSVQTMAAILEADPPDVSSLRPGTPPAVVQIVQRCLAKRPEDRYASTRMLARELREASDVLVMASRSSHTGKLAPVRRSLRPAAFAVIVRRGLRPPAFMVILALVAAGAAIWLRTRTPDASPVLTTSHAGWRQIVVLPFANISRDPDDQVFVDGLVETLTSSLTQLERFQRSLRVVPSTEVRTSRVTSAREGLQAFGASLAITGSVQRTAGALRLTLNLVDASQQVQIASRTLDVALGEHTAVQDVVVNAATGLLALELEPEAQRALTAGGSRVPGAYEAFVQGRGHLQRFDRGDENIDRAIAALTRAVTTDPAFALAHAALGEAFWRKHEQSKQPQWIDRAVEHCERALAVDSRLAPVHVTLALVARGRGRYEEALAVSQRAIELDPTSADGYRELARAYEALNRMPDAEATYPTPSGARRLAALQQSGQLPARARQPRGGRGRLSSSHGADARQYSRAQQPGGDLRPHGARGRCGARLGAIAVDSAHLCGRFEPGDPAFPQRTLRGGSAGLRARNRADAERLSPVAQSRRRAALGRTTGPGTGGLRASGHPGRGGACREPEGPGVAGGAGRRVFHPGQERRGSSVGGGGGTRRCHGGGCPGHRGGGL
jgi:serine/threonine-protein kinase